MNGTNGHTNWSALNTFQQVPPLGEEKAPSPTPCEALALEVVRLRAVAARKRLNRYTVFLEGGRELVIYARRPADARKKVPAMLTSITPGAKTALDEPTPAVLRIERTGYLDGNGRVVTEDTATLVADVRKAPGS
jgi:hypothetical protein